MKTKILLFLGMLFFGSYSFAQYASGTITLGSSGMTLKIGTTATTATITLTGPNTVYLGINFGSNGMGSGTDGFIYNSTSNLDYTFNGVGSAPSPDASQDWTIVSNTVSGSTRTIVATRSLAGGTGDYAFTNAATTVPISYAVGSGLSLAYHSNRGYANLTRTLGVEDVDLKNKFMIYPNPVKNDLTFERVNEIKAVSIYDTNGRLISKETQIKEKMDVSQLNNGVYFVEIQDKEGKVIYHKLIKE